MAIQIIKMGHIYKEATCKYCGCIFKYEKEDVIEYIKRDIYGLKVDYYIEHCPFCNHRIEVEKFERS